MAKTDIGLGNDAAVEKTIDILIADFNDNPELPTAIFQIGEEYYNKAFNTKGDPNLPEAKTKEYFQKALAVWERIIQKLPPSPTTPQAYWCSAVVYSQELGEYQKGIEYYQHVVDTWPDYDYAWSAQLLVGRYYQRLRDTGGMPESEANSQIEHAYQAVLDNYPDSEAAAQAALELGRWNFKKARWLDAAEYFELFINKDGGKTAVLIPGALYDLGRAYENADLPDQAAEVYRKLVDVTKPDDSLARAAKARLIKLEGGTK
jgi:tetratricopeptide (TPR) repeat protein